MSSDGIYLPDTQLINTKVAVQELGCHLTGKRRKKDNKLGTAYVRFRREIVHKRSASDSTVTFSDCTMLDVLIMLPNLIFDSPGSGEKNQY